MLKKLILLLLLGHSIHAMTRVENEEVELSKKWSTTKKVAVFGAIGIGAGAAAVVCAPVLVSAGTVVGAKAIAATIAAKAGVSAGAVTAGKVALTTALWAKSAFIAAPLTTKISISISGGYGVKWAKECFYPTPEQELAQLVREEAAEQPFAMQVKEAFKRNRKLHAKKV